MTKVRTTTLVFALGYLASCDADPQPGDGGGVVDIADPLASGVEGPGDVDAPNDPFLEQLDHAWAGPTDTGFVMVGFDVQDNEIGRISLYQSDSLIRLTQVYLRQCEGQYPGAEQCADVFEVSWHPQQ